MGSRLLRLATILAVIGGMYGVSLSGYFVSDDAFYVQLAARLADASPAEVLASLFAAAGDASGTQFYRPLTFGSFVSDYSWSGVEPLGYRLTSLSLHFANAVVLGALVRVLVRNVWAGVLAAVLFALFPANPEAVAWISARGDPLVGIFFLLGALCFVRRIERGTGGVWLTAGALLMACGSKEPGVMLAPVLAVYAFLAAPGRPGARARHAFAATWWLWLCVAAYFLVRLAVLGTLVGGHHYVDADPWTLTYWWARCETVGVLLAPVHLEVLSWWWKPATLVLVVATVILGWVAVRREAVMRRAFVFAGAWVVLALMPTFQMDVDAVNLFGSRVLYGASAALSALLAIAALGIARKSSIRVALLVSLTLFVSYAILTHGHLRYWTEAGRLSRVLHREMGMGPLDLSPEHQGMLVEVFHGTDGVLGAAHPEGQFAGLTLVERRIVAAAGARLVGGDDTARAVLVECLMSADRETRVVAITALEQRFGERRGYDPDAPHQDRDAAAARWR